MGMTGMEGVADAVRRGNLVYTANYTAQSEDGQYEMRTRSQGYADQAAVRLEGRIGAETGINSLRCTALFHLTGGKTYAENLTGRYYYTNWSDFFPIQITLLDFFRKCVILYSSRTMSFRKSKCRASENAGGMNLQNSGELRLCGKMKSERKSL